MFLPKFKIVSMDPGHNHSPHQGVEDMETGHQNQRMSIEMEMGDVSVDTPNLIDHATGEMSGHYPPQQPFHEFPAPGTTEVDVKPFAHPVMYQQPGPQSQQGVEASPNSNELMVVLRFLKKHNLKGTEELLKREANVSELDVSSNDTDVNSALSLYASDEDPDEYTDAYIQLKTYIDTALDMYKYEVGQILWPVFVHMYLELVYNEHEQQAKTFFARFSKMQETFHESDLVALGSIVKKEHLRAENIFRPLSMCLTNPKGAKGVLKGTNSLYIVRMSREAQSLLKRFLSERRLKLIQNIVQERLFLDVYDGAPRGKAAINAVAGHFMGEATRQENKVKVYYGLLREPDLQNVQVDVDDEDGGGGGGGEASGPGTTGSQGSSQGSSQKSDAGTPSSSQGSTGTSGSSQGDKPPPSKKKKSKKEWLLSKKGKNDPNAPPISRMPLPELRDIDKLEKAKALRESAKRVTLNAERLPSICMYTLLNADNLVCCIKWSDDGSLLAVGFSTSIIKMWSMTSAKLKKLKPASELAEIDRESDDVLVRMMDDRTGEMLRTLRGHSGPVYSMDFSVDKSTFLSSSEDSSIRLWSLLTWTCLVVYKGHLFPVWKVAFSPHGAYYFASGGHDRTARLWGTDNYQPLRVFAGHYSDVTVVVFHPNSNYVATGSSDRSVRLWDCVSGACVRLMTGHKGMVDTLLFSNDGRFLASSGTDSKVLLWDISNGGLLTALTLHTGPVFALAFSREGSILATGGQDACVRLWNFAKITEDVIAEDGAAIAPEVKKLSCSHFLVGEYPTKNVPIYGLHFTRRNVLLASGPFQAN